MRIATKKRLKKDLALVVFASLLTYLLVQSGAFDAFLTLMKDRAYTGSFIAGMFFTSVFTIAGAAVVLAQITEVANPFMVALLGGFGAMIGDLVIFLFVRDRLEKDLIEAAKEANHGKPIKAFKSELMRHFYPILGAFVIALPLPDELGLALLGFSNLKARTVASISFVMNFLSILGLAGLIRLF